jgi:hypothetical protein
LTVAGRTGEAMSYNRGNVVSESSLFVSADVMRRLNYLADKRQKDVNEVLAEAVGLEEEYVNVKINGGKMLIVNNGQLEELIPPQVESRIPSQRDSSERRPRM